ncbi:MAG: hypothetical protein QME71_03290 [Dehalococcoidia bacterium]|nr:hypothetical protein [Dehalococcoidia bacterium]
MEFLDAPDVALEQYRRELVLREPSLRHYEEFGEFMRRHFRLTPADVAARRRVYFRSDGGRLYEIAFLGGTGGAFPSGLEIFLLMPELEATPEQDDIDADIWFFLRRVVEGVGGEWTLERFNRMVGLYGLPFTPP